MRVKSKIKIKKVKISYGHAVSLPHVGIERKKNNVCVLFHRYKKAGALQEMCLRSEEHLLLSTQHMHLSQLLR